MNIASCGLGTNSVAGIIHAVNNGIVFDEILFANTGRGRKFGERQATYDYLKIFNRWLAKHGQKEIKIVFSKNAKGKSISLYEEMYKLNTLPPIVFGNKHCSQRFKKQPQEKYLNNNNKAKEVWAAKDKVTKWIFYDAGEEHRAKDYEDEKYNVRYYLIEQGIDRAQCEQIIIGAELPLPAKSSCFYCPSMQPHEIIDLYETNRSDFYKAVDMERNAASRMTAIKGLGRDFSWWDLIKVYRYMKWIRKSEFKMGVVLHKSITKLMKKINTSYQNKGKPKRRRLIKKNATPKEIACTLFTVHNEMPCGCYDN